MMPLSRISRSDVNCTAAVASIGAEGAGGRADGTGEGGGVAGREADGTAAGGGAAGASGGSDVTPDTVTGAGARGGAAAHGALTGAGANGGGGGACANALVEPG